MGKFKSRRMILIIAGVLLAAAGILLAAKLLWNMNAREFYFKAESNNFRKYSQWINKNYTSFMENQMPYTDTAYRRRVEFTADIKSGGKPFGLKDADRLSDLVKRSKLVVDTKRQPEDDTAITNVALLIEKAPFIDAELFTKAGKLYFTVPVLLPDKYFSANIDKIDEVYDKFSIPVRPKRLINAAEIAQALKFNETELDRSAEKLSSVFSNLITEDVVKYGQETELTISGQTVKGREVLVSLDSPSATALLGELAGFITVDETLLAYTYGNFADLSTMLDDAGLFRLFEFMDESGIVVLDENEKGLVNRLNVRKDLEGFRKAFKESLSNYVIKDGLKMAVIIDKAGNILDRKLTLDLTAPEGGKSFKLELNTGSSSTVFEDCRNRFIKIVVTELDTGGDAKVDDGSASDNNTANDSSANKANSSNRSIRIIELLVTPVFAKPVGTETQGNIDISYAVTAQSGIKSGTDISLELSGKTDSLTLKRNNIVKYQMKMYGEGGEGNFDGELNRFTWKNKKLNTANSTTKITVQANLPSFGIKDLSAVVNMAGEDRLGIEPFTLPDVQKTAVTDLNAATEKDLDRIEMEMLSSFGTFYLANKSVFDAILGQ